jgi:hypothetical protein
LLSTSGLFDKEQQPWIYNAFIQSAESTMEDDMATVMEKLLKRTYRLVKDKGGIFGINVMVSAELMTQANIIIDTAIKVREANPDMKNNFKVIFTSAGDPVGWKDKIKGAGFTWMHVVPSVKGAQRCKKAGVDVIVASGHEGGFHTSWEPVHSMPTVRRWRRHWSWAPTARRWEPDSWPLRKATSIRSGKRPSWKPVTGQHWWPAALSVRRGGSKTRAARNMPSTP